MVTRRVTFSVLLALAACPLAAAAQQPPAPTIEQRMSAPERRATGMSKLTAAERRALARWVARQRELAASAAAGIPIRKGDAVAEAAPAPLPPPPSEPTVAPTPADPSGFGPEARGMGRRMAMRPMRPVRPAAGPRLIAFDPVPPGHRVRRVFDDGMTVMLDDGSLWEIGPEHRTTSDSWVRGDFVTIERIGAPTGDYVFRLLHGESGNGAAAKLVDRRR